MDPYWGFRHCSGDWSAALPSILPYPYPLWPFPTPLSRAFLSFEPFLPASMHRNGFRPSYSQRYPQEHSAFPQALSGNNTLLPKSKSDCLLPPYARFLRYCSQSPYLLLRFLLDYLFLQNYFPVTHRPLPSATISETFPRRNEYDRQALSVLLS